MEEIRSCSAMIGNLSGENERVIGEKYVSTYGRRKMPGKHIIAVQKSSSLTTSQQYDVS